MIKIYCDACGKDITQQDIVKARFFENLYVERCEILRSCDVCRACFKKMIPRIKDRETMKESKEVAGVHNDGDYPEVPDNQYDNMTGTMNL